MSEIGRQLCVAAFWVDDVDGDSVTKFVAAAVKDTPGRLDKSGSIVTLMERNVDYSLRQFLVALNLEEAAWVFSSEALALPKDKP